MILIIYELIQPPFNKINKILLINYSTNKCALQYSSPQRGCIKYNSNNFKDLK